MTKQSKKSKNLYDFQDVIMSNLFDTKMAVDFGKVNAYCLERALVFAQYPQRYNAWLREAGKTYLKLSQAEQFGITNNLIEEYNVRVAQSEENMAKWR